MEPTSPWLQAPGCPPSGWPLRFPHGHNPDLEVAPMKSPRRRVPAGIMHTLCLSVLILTGWPVFTKAWQPLVTKTSLWSGVRGHCLSFRQEFEGSVYVLGSGVGRVLSHFSICYHPSFRYPRGSQKRAWTVRGLTEERSTWVESIQPSPQTPIPLSQRPQSQPPHICSVDIYAVATCWPPSLV